MTNRRISVISLFILLGIGAYFGSSYFRQADVPAVDVEPIRRRNLQAIVSSSGTIQPQLSVDISASVMGRVTQLAVNEGDLVEEGQFLLQIDPESLESAVERGEASLSASESAREQAEVSVMTATVNVQLARDHLERQEELWELRLISQEVYDQAVSDVELRETDLESRKVEVATAEQRIRQERAQLDSARYDLSQVTIVSPMSGVVTRRNIEEGETVVVGTMNNAGTVLLTIADFSILEAELEVDETDIPDVKFGQEAEIEIDAFPGQMYKGYVTEIGNSPIQDSGQQQATNFKVVVTLNDDVPNVRPGFTCTADITTNIRNEAISVPIQATTVREIPNNLALTFPNENFGVTPSVSASTSTAISNDRPREVEGVFLIRDGQVQFTEIVTGIAGERYFEALSGVREGDLIITGPFNVVRNLSNGDPVRMNEVGGGRRSGSGRRSNGSGFSFSVGR